MKPDFMQHVIESLLRQIQQLHLDVANRDAKILELSAKMSEEGGDNGVTTNDGQSHAN